jgi:diaminohydroxyphosphoribosylaminopyrimidine deaminase/5-amino-6-(5-phosphoribosylamino)uracil reductase
MSEFTASDSAHMALALALSERGRFTAHPNPVVGCVLVKDDVVVGEGWHQRTGGAHAEVNALESAGDNARGATAYVTLEPCAHHGKTPPCAEALVKAGISKVVAAITDPYHEVAGRGLSLLVDAGIEVHCGLMEGLAAESNRGFLLRVREKRPLVRVKIACSIDGAMAMANGESQWITGPEARADVQRLRARSGAVMTGIASVLADDPSLNVRAKEIDTGGLQPLRVVLDSRMRMPRSAKMLSLPGDTLVCTCREEGAALSVEDAEVQTFPSIADRVNVRAVLGELASRGINEVLVEAGPVLTGHLLEYELVDELVIYQAPHIMGSQTKHLAETPSWTSLTDRLVLDTKDVRRFGRDTRIIATPSTAN